MRIGEIHFVFYVRRPCDGYVRVAALSDWYFLKWYVRFAVDLERVSLRHVMVQQCYRRGADGDLVVPFFLSD